MAITFIQINKIHFNFVKNEVILYKKNAQAQDRCSIKAHKSQVLC